MKKSILFTLLFVFSLVIAACSNDEKDEATPAEATSEYPAEVTIGYQIIPNAELLAKELGLVEEKFPNTKINWVQFDSGRDVNTAMASGDIDLGLAGSVPVVTGIANKLAYKVYYIHDIIGEAESLVVNKDLNITSFEDLKGKRLAVPFGSTAHFSLLKALDSKNINSNDVEILDMQPQDILAAWQRGDIDGAYVWHPTLGKIQESNGQNLVTSEELATEGIITSDIGIVSNSFSEQYPQFVKDYKSILDDAISKYREDPNNVAKTLTSALGVTEAEVLAQIEGLIWINEKEQQAADYLGSADQIGQFAQILETTGTFLVEQKIISSNPKLSTFEEAIYYNK